MQRTGDPGLVFLQQKTLSTYYGDLRTLGSYLLATAGDTLMFHSDPIEYCTLLDSTICAPRAPRSFAKSRSFPEPGSTDGTQQEVIDKILCDLERFRRPEESPDVLLGGNRLTADRPINVERPALENRNVRSPSTALRSLPWRILRSRLGDDGFRYLFLSTSLFFPLGNNCYIQFSGPPIYDLYNSHEEGRKSDQIDDIRPLRPSKERKRARKYKAAYSDPTTEINKEFKSSASTNINRLRMFYGRPCRSPLGGIIPGLSTDHILSKISSSSDSTPSDSACLNLLRTIFPSVAIRLDPVKTLKRGAEHVRGLCRVTKMTGAMRELLVRHRRVEYALIYRHATKMLVGKSLLVWRLIVPKKDVQMNNYSPLVKHAEYTPRQGASSANIRNRTGNNYSRLQVDHSAQDNMLPAPRSVSHNIVCRYVISILRVSLSSYLVGSQHNLQVIVQNARRLVCTKMYEPITVHSLMQGMRVNDFKWLAIGEGIRVPPQESAKRRQLVEEFICWLFNDFIINVLKGTFYITETATTRYQTVYYGHDEWARATDPHFSDLKHSLLEELDEAGSRIALQGPLGVSAVRLIPKPSGFRPIVNLGRRIKSRNSLDVQSAVGKTTTANDVLRGVHQVLTFEKNRWQEVFSSSLFGTNDLFGPLQALKVELNEKYTTMPRLYFAKMDIRAAFDTIKQAKMLEIVEQLLDKNHDYCVLLYCLLLPPASNAFQGSARRLFKYRAMIDDNKSSMFSDEARQMADKFRNAVLIDLGRRQGISREACLELLRIHIQQNIWQIGHKLYRQTTGIPQGSKISSLLCSFFYASLEAEHLSWTRQKGTRLLRYIDDFLLITDDYAVARRFVTIMAKGFPDYGAFVSPTKTLLSFELTLDGQSVAVAPFNWDARCQFPYCGFFINTQTLDIAIDHERLIRGRESYPEGRGEFGHTLIMVSHTTVFRTPVQSTKRGIFHGMVEQSDSLRIGITSPTFLDTMHNHTETVYLNIFVNFALTAMKIPHYFGRIALDQSRSATVYYWLCMAVEYTYRAGRARVRHAARGEQRDHFTVPKKTFLYIAKVAVTRVLALKAPHLSPVIKRLKRELAKREYRALNKSMASILERGWIMVQGRSM